MEYSGSSLPVQLGPRWTAGECWPLERIIPQGERNRRNNAACIASVGGCGYFKKVKKLKIMLA
jgi:hypothetical protein